jgi:putative ABC transport system ATP-binding protein
VGVLAAEGVSMTFRTEAGVRDVLRNVDLAFHAGTVSLLKGPSGSGKTTLLSILGGLLRPCGGRVVMSGMDIYGVTGGRAAACRRRGFGFIFQSCQLFPTLTAVENVRIPLDLRGDRRPAADSTADRLLAAVGLGDRRSAHPRHLSGGEQQRVAIARALVADPAVILADEPTAALDAAAGREVAAVLSRLGRDFGKTVVIVSHDERLVEFADRVVGLLDGVVVSDHRVGAA